MEATSVDLGFVENCESWLLTNKFFPSKVGGKPAWLELRHIPPPQELHCGVCKEPMNFLCQIYAPNEKVPHAFHRSVFLFICRNGSCCEANSAKNLKVFRSQLPRRNEFYSFDPPNEEKQSEAAPSPVSLCRICGCRAPSSCSQCKEVFYCGTSHQRVDWKGRHKQECSGKATTADKLDILFKEKELVIEEEELESRKTESSSEAEARRLKEYEEVLKSGKVGLADVPDAEVEQYVNEEEEDKTFSKFRERTKFNPEQVVRYDRGGSPLWITGESQLKVENVPKCSICQGIRSFEFQVMPQLLNVLGSEELDWGIIAVFTCSQDCDVEGQYAEEFVYKQDLVKGLEEE